MSRKNYWVGIDPGKNGGIAWIDRSKEFECAVMPDMFELPHLLDNIGKIKHIYVEHAQPMPKQGTRSMFTYGEHFGSIQGILVAKELPFSLVKPKTWQAEMFKGTRAMCGKTKVNPKKRALEAANRYFARQKSKFFKSSRSYVPHDGLIDSVLIAEFCRKSIG